MNSERCTFEIRLKPRAKRNSIILKGSAQLDVSVTSPSVENRANEHLVEILAKALGVSRSSVRLIKGEHCRSKVVAIEGMDQKRGEELIIEKTQA